MIVNINMILASTSQKNTPSEKYELDKIEYENYLHLNGKTPERRVIYNKGK